MPLLARRSRLLTVLVTLSMLFAATATGAHAATDTQAEQEFASLINAERAARGLPALGVASDLTKTARAHSVVMASSNRLHHNPNLSSDVCCWTRLSENVGRGSSVSSLMNAFMASSGHRRNILDGNVTQMGVGVEKRGGTYWVTQVFRKPTSSAPKAIVPASTNHRGTAVVGDWNGDGVDTPGWFKDGVWTVSDRIDGKSPYTIRYGRAGDKPVVGDWNGDGRDTVGVVRGNRWILRRTYVSGDDIIMTYGRSTDIPVTGDWNGDGRDTIGVVRGNRWILRYEYRSGADIVMTYGRAGDKPVTGDWNGDGRDTIGVVRDNRWILRYLYRSGSDIVMTYGRSTDLPVAGDWKGTGTDMLGVVRENQWILRYAYRSGADIITSF